MTFILAGAIGGSLAIAALALWLVSLRRSDASIADIFWGLGFVLVAGLAAWLGDGFFERKVLVTGLVALWGVRLALYLAWRNHGRGEDPRYQAMRAAHGDRWPLRSLFQVFVLQNVLIAFIALPVVVAQAVPLPPSLTGWDLAGALLVLAGLAFEATGDYQLARFKADPAHRGQVMDRGLWRYTRHPNYFGDACVWWGFYLIACATGVGAWTLASPLLMTFLLVRVSGVTLLESAMASRPGYAEYIQRTSAFIPRPPRA